MKLLLDTHTFIWWNSNSSKLSKRALELCSNRNNNLFLSLVSIWEITIKSQLGKLSLNESLTEIIEKQQKVNNLQILPIDLNHILALHDLPLHHRDPFDRLLISQAILENATLISRDSVFQYYSVRLEW